MNLKKRLAFSNAVITLLPLLITVAAAFIFVFVSSRLFNANVSFDNIKKLSEVQFELFNASGRILNETPEMLMDREYQEYLTARLASINAGIAVVKGREIAFSTLRINKIDVEKCLEASTPGLFSKSVPVNGIEYVVKAVPVSFKDGDQGDVILLSPLNREWRVTRNFIFFLLGTYILSFLIVNSLTSLAFTRVMLRPLSRLKTAAGEISRGNLDYEISEDGEGEIRELCRSFEQMRLKLKESVHTQMKYDDNRKMLVSSISHDLKTPITSIRGYVEGILDGVANSPEKVEKYLRTVYSKAAQVDVMIDDLLLYSKLDLNQIPFNFENTDIVRYFEDCVGENEHELEKAGIRISLVNKLKEQGCVLLDRERMRRVVINILDNAKKYMNKHPGEIAIVLREAGSNIVIEIRDNGAGIPKDDLPFIFDRFYRADAARSRINGSGLGLAIARQIIEGHGGKIWVTSRENEGTNMMISLKKVLCS